MEILITLTQKDNLIEYTNERFDGFIIGSLFSMKFNYSFEEMLDIYERVKQHGFKVYISIDTFINESDIKDLYLYLERLNGLQISGIYFNDLAVIEVAKSYGMESLLIFDGGQILTNSLDIESYLSLGINSAVIAREVTMEETLSIIKNCPKKLDMQIYGHVRLSTSKRRFVTNYFKQIKKNFSPKNLTNLSLVEEQRDYRLPIMEGEYGTTIYSDFIVETIEEFPYLYKVIKRGIIDDSYIPFVMIKDFLRALDRCDEKNSYFVDKAYCTKYRDEPLCKGFLYIDEKEEVEENGQN